MSQISDYTGLITSEHAPRPKFVGTVALAAQPYVDWINFMQALPLAFDIDYAVGPQQDILGQWVGVKRNLQAISPGLHTQAPLGSVPLNDSDYSFALHSKVRANSFDGTIANAYSNLSLNFLGSGCNLFMVDNQDMTMVTAIAGNVPTVGLQAALLGGYLEIRPATVLSTYFIPTAPGGPLFAFDIENAFMAGFDVGVWSQQIG